MKWLIFAFMIYYMGVWIQETACNYCAFVPRICIVAPLLLFAGAWGVCAWLILKMDEEGDANVKASPTRDNRI